MKEEKEELINEQEEKAAETSEKVTDEVENAVEEEAGKEEELDEMEELKTQVSEAKDKYLRLYSEFENFRRRTSKEKLELIATAGREVMEAMLPILDDFERSLQAQSDEGDESKEGVRLIYNKFKNVLEAKGLKRMEVSAGDEFDDEFHEAITQIPAPSEELAGKIVDVVEPGYFLGEKVIRFAKVVTGAKS